MYINFSFQNDINIKKNIQYIIQINPMSKLEFHQVFQEVFNNSKLSSVKKLVNIYKKNIQKLNTILIFSFNFFFKKRVFFIDIDKLNNIIILIKVIIIYQSFIFLFLKIILHYVAPFSPSGREDSGERE